MCVGSLHSAQLCGKLAFIYQIDCLDVVAKEILDAAGLKSVCAKRLLLFLGRSSLGRFAEVAMCCTG